MVLVTQCTFTESPNMSKPTSTFGTAAWFDKIVTIGERSSRKDIGILDAGDTFDERYLRTASIREEGTYTILPFTEDDTITPDNTSQATYPNESFDVTYTQEPFGPTNTNEFEITTFMFSPTGSSQQDTIEYLTDRVVLFPYSPLQPVKETIEFLTDVQESWSGHEQRMRTRPQPRLKMECSYEFNFQDGDDIRLIKSQLAGYVGHYITVPMWHLAREITSRTIQGGTGNPILGFDEDLFERPFMDKVFIADPSGDSWILDIPTDVITDESDDIVIPSTAENLTVQTGWLAMPVIKARMSENPSYSVTPSGAASARVVWNSDYTFGANRVTDQSTVGVEYSDLYPTTLTGDQSDTFPVIDDPHLVDNNRFSVNLYRATELKDEKTGIVELINRLDTPRPSIKKIYDITHDPSTTNDLRKFLLWTWGRQRSFWVPSQTFDLKVHPDYTGGNILNIVPEGLGYELLAGGSYKGGGYYGFIEMEMADGTIYRSTSKLEFSDTSTTKSVLSVGNGFNSASTATDGAVVRLSYMPRMRLSSDSVVITHSGRGSSRAQVNMVAVEQ